MHEQATEKLRPTITYSALVGQVILLHRKRLKLDQTDVATALGVSQSAYSRLESGDSRLSIGQLRIVAQTLGINPAELLHRADELVGLLSTLSVEVTDEKGASPVSTILALGLLASIISSANK